MLLSLSLIFIIGLLFAAILKKIKFPSIIGFLICGIILGPYMLNLIDASLLNISSELRQIALIIILLRAGLMLNLNDLKKIGRPAFLLCFIPAFFELIAIALIAPLLFDISYLEALLLGSVVAAVSPAIIVPRMIKMIENNQGTKKGVPQLIMAGASVDDVLVIVLFTVFLTLSQGGSLSLGTVISIPASIIFGVGVGVVCALLLIIIFKRYHIRDSIKVIIILSVCFALVSLEKLLSIPFSGLIATIVIGMVILYKYEILAQRLSNKYSKLWIVAEILLFVLVGASVDISFFIQNILFSILIISCGLIVRMLGVWVSLIKTKFTPHEKLFCSIAYTPKATVQAAIGSVPLALGLSSGNIILSVAVVAILLTAPIGAFLIDNLRTKLIS